MHIEFLLEEASAEAALRNIVPKILGPGVSFGLHPYQGKRDLLSKLPARLRGYRRWLPPDWRIVVLLDADRKDCRALKARLEREAEKAGWTTKSGAPAGGGFDVLNRLAVEELEAWFFGDIVALKAAYSRIKLNLARKARYRDPDAIRGGTWEALERELQRRGYFAGGLPKIRAAREISAQMEPERNRSRSFRVFRQGLLEMITRT